MHPVFVKLISTAAAYAGAVLIEALMAELSKARTSLDRSVHGEVYSNELDDNEFDKELEVKGNVDYLRVVPEMSAAEARSNLVAEVGNFARGNKVLPILLKVLQSRNSN